MGIAGEQNTVAYCSLLSLAPTPKRVGFRSLRVSRTSVTGGWGGLWRSAQAQPRQQPPEHAVLVVDRDLVALLLLLQLVERGRLVVDG